MKEDVYRLYGVLKDRLYFLGRIGKPNVCYILLTIINHE